MINKVIRSKSRKKRKLRVRSKIFGSATRPRLSVFRSLNHIYVQIINDEAGVTLVSASSAEKLFTEDGTKKEKARKIGQILAKRANEKNIKDVVFDRNGYLFHGRVKEVADGARESGLNF